MKRLLAIIKNPRVAYMALLLVICGLSAASMYYEAWKFHYLVPAGDDAQYHILRSMDMLRAGRLTLDGAYPPLYHAVIAGISFISRQSVLHVTMAVYPLFVPLSAAAVAFFMSRIFSFRAGIFSALLIVAAPHPRWYVNDGAYPQILGADILMVILVALLLTMYRRRKLSIAAPIITIAIAVTHPIAFVYTLVLSALYIVFLLTSFFRRREKWTLHIGLYHLATLVIASFVVWRMYLGSVFLPIIQELVKRGSEVASSGTEKLASFNGATEVPVALAGLPKYIGTFIVYGGIVSVGFFFVYAIRHEHRKFEYLYIVAWAIAMFIFSRTSLTLWPYRFARDLTFPLAMLVAYLLDHVFTTIHYRRVLISFSTTLIALIMFLPVVNGFLVTKSSVDNRVTPSIAKAYTWLGVHTSVRGKILAGPVTTYIGLLTGRTIDTSYNVLFSKDLHEYLVANSIEYIYLRGKPLGWISPIYSSWDWGLSLAHQNFLQEVVVPGATGDGSHIYVVEPKPL